MDYRVRIFEVKREAKKDEAPVEIEGFAVTGDTAEEARRATLSRLGSDGRTVRALSFTFGNGIAAVVYQREPVSAAAPAVPRRPKRGR